MDADSISETSDGVPTFSMPQPGFAGQPLTLSPQAQSVWRQQLSKLQHSPVTPHSRSFAEHATQNLTRTSENEATGCTSTPCDTESCATCYPLDMSGVDGYGDNGIVEHCYEKVKDWVPPMYTCDQESCASYSVEGDPDNLEKRQHGDDAVNENGRVVAYILLLSVASVIICTLWAIVRIVPLLIIPALFLFRKNFALLDMLKNKWNYVYGTGSGEEEEQLREEPLDDTDIYAKLAKLEYENRRLLAELEKRKQITEELWRQLEEYTSRSSPTEASIEREAPEELIG